jgi:hypothetical protein
MRRIARENLTANRLRVVDAADPTQTARLSGEVDNADARRAGSRRVWPARGRFASLIGRTSFFSVHVPSTGPMRINQPRRADIGPIAVTAKDNLTEDAAPGVHRNKPAPFGLEAFGNCILNLNSDEPTT